MRKKIFNHWLSWAFPLFISIILALALFLDRGNSIPPSLNLSIIIIIAIISYGSVEWVVFKIEFNNRIKSNAEIGLLLNEFAEANHLFEKVSKTAKKDLEFDKFVKLKSEHKPFQLFLSALKYEYYLSSYFKYNNDENSPAITKIPRYYFEDYRLPNGEKHSVWMWLIDKTQRYKSIQVLNHTSIPIYINNLNRAETESNYLRTQYENKHAKLKSIEKLFVITKQWLSDDGTEVVDRDVNELLKIWKNHLNSMSKTSRKRLQIKFISLEDAKGALSNDYIEDIGIFDNILGIQKPIETNESLINDGTDISFYFEPLKVKKWKDNFDTIFTRAHLLIK